MKDAIKQQELDNIDLNNLIQSSANDILKELTN
jgi:hypothetical protein